jgi:hypothetical protein
MGPPRGGQAEGEEGVTKQDLDLREIYLLAAAKGLAEMMHHWNVVDQRELVIEDRHAETPYYHVTTALEKILILAGLTADEKMGFYEMVTTGMSPMEARQRLLDHRPEPDTEDDEC